MKVLFPVALLWSLLLFPAISWELRVALITTSSEYLPRQAANLSAKLTLQDEPYSDRALVESTIADASDTVEASMAAPHSSRRGSGRRSIWNG